MKIGLIDSGSGCLSVLHEAYHTLPIETEYVIYADLDHVPYGTKTKEEIIELTRKGMQFLVDQGVEAVVIACNTATGAAIKIMREEFKIPIVGMEPAVKPALEIVYEEAEFDSASDNHAKTQIDINSECPAFRRVLAAATPLAVKAEKFNILVERYDKHNLVDPIALPGLVSFAEEELFDEDVVCAYLQQVMDEKNYHKEAYGALVLGCTHFNYFKPMFRRLFGQNITFVDGRHGTVRHLANLVGIEHSEEEVPLEFHSVEELKEKYHSAFYISGRPATPEQDSHWLRMMQRLEKIRHV